VSGTGAFFARVARDWMAHRVPSLAAALAFYAVFSLAPLLVAAIGVAGYFFDEEAARSEVVAQFESFLGQRAGDTVEAMLTGTAAPERERAAALLGLAVLLFGASGVFGALQEALNAIWEVAPKAGAGWTTLLRRRFVSFAMVLGTGFLLLVSLLLSAALAAGSRWFAQIAPDAEALWRSIDGLVGIAVPTTLFALIFRYVPDARVAWRDVWVGAILTSALFALGRWGIGYYLGRKALDSTFGAAASLVVLVLWVYYSAHILFLGAEFTQALGDQRGARAVPPLPGAERAPAR
jgi:membrane protein